MESCGPGFLQAFRISLWATERVDIPIVLDWLAGYID